MTALPMTTDVVSLHHPIPNGAGYSPDGILEVDAPTAAEWFAGGRALLIDVREANEIENEHVPGALLMPLSFFDADAFPRVPGMDVVLFCAVGKRSAAATKQLVKAGYPAPINMVGGLNAWKQAGLPTEE